jgi:hypothetical protein
MRLYAALFALFALGASVPADAYPRDDREPEPEPDRTPRDQRGATPTTPEDQARLAAAEAKRRKRAAKRRK